MAAGYADQLRGAIAGSPLLRMSLTVFAGMVGDGPVADVGCGPGHVTEYLRESGVDAFGIDLSPGMIAVARRAYPGVRFAVGSMTALPVRSGSVAGVLAWWSLIHVPDAEIPLVLGHFHRALRQGGLLAAGFHVGAGTRRKTAGYGGLAMYVDVHRRTPARMTGWLEAGGFEVVAEWVERLDEAVPQAVLSARRT
ncbi:class I SAM-dependent methyltransferase [Amycolatopsis jejuensis]|uniref:class I SAM-dependent methyltransferase n=1 Tax=Amycolatopsis jejuensis TaxID=330084 RepID=UPI00068AB7A4|nr:class I SAM-dependent methyltransferase [Amycolatopsis jejuensis]